MTAPNATNQDDTPRRIDLSVTQVLAAALAAVTAAVLGSMFSIAGTVIGAAAASMTLNVGTAVYRASLERSRERLRSLAQRTLPLPRHQEEVGTEHSDPAGAASPGEEQTAGSEEQTAGSNDNGQEPEARSRRFSRLRWGTIVVGTVGGFALAMLAITGFERVSGEQLSGDGSGTTIGQVFDSPPAPPVPDSPSSVEAPSQSPTTQAPTESTAPEAGPDAEPGQDEAAETPTPTELVPTPPLLPTRLPGG